LSRRDAAAKIVQARARNKSYWGMKPHWQGVTEIRLVN
jgi:hypothetical protein